MTDKLNEKFEKWLAKPENRLLCNQSLTSFTAGYELAKEEQDSNLTCDHCCNELGMDDGSIRLCGECNGWTNIRDKQPELNKEVIMCRDGVINAGAFYAKNQNAGGFVWLFQSGLTAVIDVNDVWQPLPEPPKSQ